MIISRLEELNRTKIKVYIDGEYAFPLYRKDIIRYRIEEGHEISTIIYDQIIEETILRRAKQKALAVLKYMDRTEYELRYKLSEADYPQDIIDRVIDYVSGYGYLNDERYASIYIRYKKDSKSIRMIHAELTRKGIKKEIIENIISLEYTATETEDFEDPEITAIKKAVAKKTMDPENLSWEEKQKIIAFLYRKGFDIDKIHRILS